MKIVLAIISGVLLLSWGIVMLLIGYKVINVFSTSWNHEKVEVWYKKYGPLLKICGIAAIIGAVVNVLMILIFVD